MRFAISFISFSLFSLLTATFSIAQSSAVIGSSGLRALFPFDGNANDASENGNTLLSGENIVPTEDRFNNPSGALLFSEDFSALTFQNTAINFATQGLSISLWFKRLPCIIPCSNNVLFESGFFSINPLEPDLQRISISIFNDRIMVGTKDVSGNYIYSIGSIANNPTYNAWNNLIVTLSEGSAGSVTASIYLNGILDNVMPISLLVPFEDNPEIFSIGAGIDNLNAFRGAIDEVAIYNRVITPSEVITLSNPGSNGSSGDANSTNQAVPPGIPYQAVARDLQGNPISNNDVQVRFSIRDLTPHGDIVYSEEHAIQTDNLGLFSSTIGSGSPINNGNFNQINWAQTTKFLQVELNFGNGFTDFGTQQLMSVPYALYAGNSQPGPQGPMGPQGSAGQNGDAGPTGPSGMPGKNSLIKTSVESNGSNCDGGGLKIECGLDLNANNILESEEINLSNTRYLCSESNSVSKNIADWKLPDGFVNVQMVNWELGITTGVSQFSHNPYTVPLGKNLYIKSITSSQAFNGCNPGVAINGIQVNNSSCGGATTNQIFIVPSGSQLTFNGGCNIGSGCSTPFANFTGFLVDASVTAILQSSPVLVPSGSVFIAYSNSSIPSFFTEGQSVPSGINGYFIPVQ
jgi:hypothetical protein